MGYIVRATWTVQDGHEEAVLANVKALTPLSRAEPGCQFYQAYQDPAAPQVIHLFEIYDDEAAYHRNPTNRINARYGEALDVWQERIVAYVGHRDEQTGQLAKYLDGLKRKGVDAERMLDLAVARKPLPVDHPTAALAFRVKDLVARRARRPAPVDDLRRTTPSSSGPALGP